MLGRRPSPGHLFWRRHLCAHEPRAAVPATASTQLRPEVERSGWTRSLGPRGQDAPGSGTLEGSPARLGPGAGEGASGRSQVRGRLCPATLGESCPSVRGRPGRRAVLAPERMRLGTGMESVRQEGALPGWRRRRRPWGG